MIKTLKGRISALYFGLVLLSALVGLTAVIDLFSLGNVLEGLMTANYRSIQMANRMLDHLAAQDYALSVYIKGEQKQGIDLFVTAQNQFLKAYNFEDTNVTETGERQHVDKLGKSYWEFTRLFAELQEVRNKKGATAAADYYNGPVRSKLIQVRSALNEILKLNEKAMFHRKDEVTANTQRSMYLVLFISLTAVIGGFGAARFFVNRFFEPVAKLKETLKLVRAGDLNQQAEIVYQDEIGELAAEFNNMTKRLMQYERSTVGQLMAEKNRSMAIVKSISDPLIVLDRHYQFLLINDAGETFFEVNENQALHRHFLEVIRNNDLFGFIAGPAIAKEDSRQKVFLVKSMAKDFYFNVVVKPVLGVEADEDSMVILFQNITQIKQLEKTKADFTATISHEFKTPLTSILMGLSLLEEEKIGSLNDKQCRLVATIKEDGESLANLVVNLLEISKMESGKSAFQMQPCSIGGIVEKAVKNFMRVAEAKEVSLNFDVSEELPKVIADPEKIAWVMNNLIQNALKYTNAGDEIEIAAAVNHGKMCVSVRDTGVGIPAEYLDKLFDKFIQVKGYDLEVRGTGLGLSIAKEIVEAHGGEIWCESKIDLGSTFIFTLPLELR